MNEVVRILLDALSNTDMDNLYNELSKIRENTLTSGSGGSLVVSTYLSHILERKNNIVATNIRPRDLLYKNTNPYSNLIICSYSGNNHGVTLALNSGLNVRVFSPNSSTLKYQMEKERSFISLASTLTPMAILLSYYLDGDFSIIKEILNMHIDSVEHNPNIEVFGGFEVETPSVFIDSTCIESGLASVTIHDKYDYCHGRSTYGYNFDTLSIYFDRKKELDRLLLKLLEQKKLIKINSISDDFIIDEFYFTYMSMLLLNNMAEEKNIDLRRVKYNSDIVKKVYHYKGEM